MFEYLMPLLFMRRYPGTLLDQSCRACVRRQIEYGEEHGIPWGISESAYAVTDRAGTYQYKAFGVPGLGLKRGLSDELVVAPYATALASLVDPAAAAANFRRLARLGLDGRFGFCEAIDYRPRLETDAAPASPADPAVRSSCGPTSRTIRACRSWRSPTWFATTCSSHDFTANAASRQPSSCSRSGCRARRFSPSRGRPKARRPRRGSGGGSRGDSGRRIPPARTCTSCRTAATPPR